MLVSLQVVLTTHRAVWEKLPAFAAAVEELDEIVRNIRSVTQTQTCRTGVSEEKALAFQALGDAAFEVAAAVRAWTSVNGDSTVASRVRFTRPEVTRGRDSAVVARCQEIHDLALEHVKSLADYGVTPAKLTGLKRKLEAYLDIQARPRTGVATTSAATAQLRALFQQARTLVKVRLDGLIVQFQSSAPVFLNEYSTARVTLSRGRRATRQSVQEKTESGTADLPAAA